MPWVWICPSSPSLSSTCAGESSLRMWERGGKFPCCHVCYTKTQPNWFEPAVLWCLQVIAWAEFQMFKFAGPVYIQMESSLKRRYSKYIWGNHEHMGLVSFWHVHGYPYTRIPTYKHTHVHTHTHTHASKLGDMHGIVWVWSVGHVNRLGPGMSEGDQWVPVFVFCSCPD